MKWLTRRLPPWPVLLAGAFVLVVSFGLMWAFLVRTDPERIAEEILGTFASFRILESPGDIREVRILVNSSSEHPSYQWVLEYQILVLSKRVTCDAILVHQRIDRVGDERPVADRTYESRIKVHDIVTQPTLSSVWQIPIQRLTEGDYTLLVEYYCLQIDPQTKVRSQVMLPARDMACFTVPFILSKDDSHPVMTRLCRPDVVLPLPEMPKPGH